MLRQAFLALSRQKTLRRWMEVSPRATKLTGRFVAGLTLDDGLRVAGKIHRDGFLASLDHLGENVTTAAEAGAARDFYMAALEALAGRGLGATVSMKLTQLGLDLGDGLCTANLESLAARAAASGMRIEIDMESSDYTERTLRIVERTQARFGCLRSVLQAYLYRTGEDARRVSRAGIPVRLCKGAYNEPRSVAYPDKKRVDAEYMELARRLLDEGVEPAIATHDPAMIDGVLAHVRARGIGAGAFEFQMLYGIRRDLQEKLVREGWRVRLYVPYGDAWYPYFMRRLAERPANVFFIARNMLRA
jgi:proline dehydrogenase